MLMEPISALRPGILRRMSIVVAGLAVCAACDQGPTEPRVLDLIADRALYTDGKPMPSGEVFAGDETWVAMNLAPQQSVTCDLDLGKDPVLELTGYLHCGDDQDRTRRGTLRVALGGGSRRSSVVELTLDATTGWSSFEVGLEAGARRRAELRLEADLPDGCALLLREATVTDRVPAPLPVESEPSQILLISVDTLRNDAVGAFGGAVATPHLDHFATESEMWVRHYAAASWTKPSHASLLTGFYPDTHRALGLEQAIDPGLPTLAERFRDAGHETAALVFDCTWLSPRWGFGKGFDSYRVSRWRAARQAGAAARWVLDNRDRDFFFFLHTFEPHSDFKLLPYEAPGLTQQTIAERFGVRGFGCRAGRCASQLVNGLHSGDVPLEERDAEILRASYDEGVRYVDRALGELFDSLRTAGVWDRMLVVVTSDHGEAFGERRQFGHNSLHEEIVRVPLMIKWPRGERAGEIDVTPRSAVDVAPTLLGFAGLDVGGLPGRDLRTPQSEAAVFTGTMAKAVIAGDDKGIFAGDLPPRIYDLSRDPGEEDATPVASPAQLRVLRALLREHRQQSLELWRVFGSRAETENVVLSESERERLRAFGYLE